LRRALEDHRGVHADCEEEVVNIERVAGGEGRAGELGAVEEDR
jgi:hypothetical protein